MDKNFKMDNSSKSWNVITFIRKFKNVVKKGLSKFNITRYPIKAVLMIFKLGIRHTARVTIRKIKMLKPVDYSKITQIRRELEESTHFDKNIKFSILVPLYNTPEQYLKEMIESVQKQTYKNWELCLADGSDNEHSNVGVCVKNYQNGDSRILYKKLEKNMGISANTNACIEMATGDYISLFDHDDILHPSALFENMQVICKENADFIYTDEATFLGTNISKIGTFHFKPNYAPDNLRANNYICHFSSFSRELLDKAGWFRNEFDGSQDHDIILRLTSLAKKVYHIPKLLYFWRSHPGSVAGDIGSKLYAIQAGRNAVAASVESNGYKCTVDSSKPCPTIYRIRYELVSTPFVSIVITNNKSHVDIKKCIDSIIKKTTYKNYEIVIVVNNDYELEHGYYYELKARSNIKFEIYRGKNSPSAANNFGALNANGDYIIFLNKQTEVITPDWIEEMLMYAQRPDVGAVSAKLYWPNKSVSRAGVILGLGKNNTAGLCYYKYPKDNYGYMGKLCYSQNLSAVTNECMMVKKQLFLSTGSFDEDFGSFLCSVDFCLKLRKLGYLIVFTPYSELYYFEQRNINSKNISEERKAETERFLSLWNDTVLSLGDPYYNPNFSLDVDYDINFDKIRQECCK